MPPLTPSTGDKPGPNDRHGEVLIRVEGVSKKFCRNLRKSLWYGVRDMMHEFNPFAGKVRENGEPELKDGEFWANRDISFEVRRGECLGLIGHNGAGKTTLLKLLNGLIKPERGRIEIHGRVGGLIALGAGFNPILTGRENIKVSAAILGLTAREIEEKADQIIEFSELREFIDTPVQNYSSGMGVRLGFAVATALEPDVLLLDEVLAVGDGAFAVKCLNRIQQLREKAAVIFVSHSEESIARICNRAILLEKGCLVKSGETLKIMEEYEKSWIRGKTFTVSSEMIQDVTLTLHEAADRSSPARFVLTITASAAADRLRPRLVFNHPNGSKVAEWRSENHGSELVRTATGYSIEARIDTTIFRQGQYIIDVAIEDSRTGELVYAQKGTLVARFKTDRTGFASIQV
ncbi:MAG: ABC transporter ATP-binding protein [Opitutaceae bacterium]